MFIGIKKVYICSNVELICGK